MSKKCPKCGNASFYANAHIVQGWLVDENGEWTATTEECVETIHEPDNDDLWTCASCGFEAPGSAFDFHANRVCELYAQRHIKIQNAAFLKTFKLDKKELPSVFEDKEGVKVGFYIPVMFDVDTAFGLDICTDENDDTVELYATYAPDTKTVQMHLLYNNTSVPSVPDFDICVDFKEWERVQFEKRLTQQCELAYGKTLNEVAAEIFD